MKKLFALFIAVIGGFMFLSFCGGDGPLDELPDQDPPEEAGTVFVCDHLVATQKVLRGIPKKYIDLAQENLHIAYQHTSHGYQVTWGMYGLPDFKPGDDQLFGIANKSPLSGKLDFNDNVLSAYAVSGEDASDLSRNETAFIQATRNYLDDPVNERINVVMWSWCNIAGHKVSQNYLPGMTKLISEYSRGGSKIGDGAGQRKNAVTFIFMTGHANKNANVGEGKPKNQADLILDYCLENKQYCLDYYNIDTHDMTDKYWEDTGDDGNSDAYGGNFYQDWQDAHALGEDWFENRKSPGGDVTYGAHNTQHITANRKAYAMWWILARIAGWDGKE